MTRSLATASPTEDTAFVRVLLLPAEWAGSGRSGTSIQPTGAPEAQRATVLPGGAALRTDGRILVDDSS